jgi:hypothetical protein
MGRKVITMAKELGTESTRYLLHSHDRLVTDETVGGANSSKSSYGMRPTSTAGNSSPGTQRGTRTADGKNGLGIGNGMVAAAEEFGGSGGGGVGAGRQSTNVSENIVNYGRAYATKKCKNI